MEFPCNDLATPSLFPLDLEHLLRYITGSSSPPPAGFSVGRISIRFDSSSTAIMASTCLPTDCIHHNGAVCACYSSCHLSTLPYAKVLHNSLMLWKLDTVIVSFL